MVFETKPVVCLATLSAASCDGGSSSSNKSNSSTPAPEPNKVTISAKAKRIEAMILRDDLVNEAELTGLPLEELRILRNVVFARHGRQYERPGLGDYFSNCAWYQPDPSRTTDDSKTDWQAILTAHDKRNTEILKLDLFIFELLLREKGCSHYEEQRVSYQCCVSQHSETD